jgi:hypothetical protein
MLTTVLLFLFFPLLLYSKKEKKNVFGRPVVSLFQLAEPKGKPVR